MNAEELDHVYTRLCRGLGDADHQRLAEALSRFALLAMLEIDDVATLDAMISRALEPS